MELVTADLSKFGHREIQEAVGLLQAHLGSPLDCLGDGLTLNFNASSGCVFLSDEDLNVGMLNGHYLEQFFSCSECGKEGFIEEWGTDDPEDDTCEGCKEFRLLRRENEN